MSLALCQQAIPVNDNGATLCQQTVKGIVGSCHEVTRPADHLPLCGGYLFKGDDLFKVSSRLFTREEETLSDFRMVDDNQ